MTYSMTLAEWRVLSKTREMIIYNASEFSKQNDEWVSFPIGIGWTFINYFSSHGMIPSGRHEKLVFSAFNTHTDARRRSSGINRSVIKATLQSNGIGTSFYDSSSFFQQLPEYKFVISPEGNGIDCHRHYEALFAGCIPIIEEHEGIREKYKGCPVLFTRDYSEITHQYLEEKYNEMQSCVWDFSRLIMSYYDSDTQEQIKTNGNYWATRLAGRVWYL